MNRFTLDGRAYQELRDAAQDAEFAHTKDDCVHRVIAMVDCEFGMFSAGEVVYESKGAP